MQQQGKKEVKMKKKVIISGFLIAIVIITATQSMADEYEKALVYLNTKGEVYFTFTIQSKQELVALTGDISIDDVAGVTVFAYANKKQFAKFNTYEYAYTVLPPPGDSQPDMKMFTLTTNAAFDFASYPAYDAYLTILNSFERDYPGLCRIVDIGQSVRGRKILFAVISDNVNTEEAEARFMYTSTMHGNEPSGYVLMLRLIDYLLSHYGSDSEITHLVDNLEIWINPLANPDGTFAAGNNTVNGSTRTNANNVDLNRNFPAPDNEHPDGEAWQPETEAFIDIANQHRFAMSCNFHGGAEVVNYPWDIWERRHADDNWYQYVSHIYADLAQVSSNSTYMTGFDDGITNGYDWYTVSGSRQDYMNYFHHCREVTVEISNTKVPPESELHTLWNYNYRSFLAYMQESLYGIKGTVTDGDTGLPIEAKIEIIGHDRDNSFVFSSNTFGDFYRPVYGGTYILTIASPPYVSQTTEVTVNNGETVTVDIQLYQSGSTPSPQGIPGDVNNDTIIDIIDALLVAQYYVGLNPDGFNPDAADVTNDRSIDIVDALRIAQCYVGLVSCDF
jgi:hypothetical protein